MVARSTACCKARTFSAAATHAITQYEWPGNVRALQHAVERATILSSTEKFEPQDFQLEPVALPSGSPDGEDLNLTRLEINAIKTALKRHRYNISHAARDLGLTRAALYRRMEKHGL